MSEMKNHPSLSKVSFAGLLITIGIVFGDIGTSPLYVVKAIISGASKIDQLLVYGALSLVFWTLTLQTTIKYVIITLRADNHGEGGIFALFALLKKKSTWAATLTMVGGSALLADSWGLHTSNYFPDGQINRYIRYWCIIIYNCHFWWSVVC